jgi:hypothetical protein
MLSARPGAIREAASGASASLEWPFSLDGTQMGSGTQRGRFMGSNLVSDSNASARRLLRPYEANYVGGLYQAVPLDTAENHPTTLALGRPLSFPAMGGEVKKHLALATEAVIRTSGVCFQFRECGAGCTDLSDRVVFGEEAAGDAWRSFLRVPLFVRNPLDLEAVLFSRKSGNHPAIRASCGHGFVRLSGGA